MRPYLAAQHTYTTFEIALFVDNHCIGQISEDKHYTSKLFIPLLDQLLCTNNLTIIDISFCAVNCGPGPFSTLRSILASVNGLHTALQLPLVGIDGLHATFYEFYNTNYAHTVVLLNAFNNEVYYLIAHNDTILATGYQHIDALLTALQQKIGIAAAHFVGNGATLYAQNVLHHLPHAVINNNADMCSVITIGKLGLEHYEQQTYHTGCLMPLYLKKHTVER
jgi:tRNA threonylcarbamoyladenosine biosynthesis protein TsaB